MSVKERNKDRKKERSTVKFTCAHQKCIVVAAQVHIRYPKYTKKHIYSHKSQSNLPTIFSPATTNALTYDDVSLARAQISWYVAFNKEKKKINICWPDCLFHMQMMLWSFIFISEENLCNYWKFCKLCYMKFADKKFLSFQMEAV